MEEPQQKKFLTGEWRKLLMANYEVDPKVLEPHVPFGTEIDQFDGHCYMSVVGFMFHQIKVLGIPAFFHRNFEEVNLRFYVRRKVEGEWRRGVVFIREIVPKPIVTYLANRMYNENYITLPMSHQIHTDNAALHVGYSWGKKNAKYHMKATAEVNGTPLIDGSEEEFITEHFWGYASKSETAAYEYKVEHPRWEIHKVNTFELNGDLTALYGGKLAKFLHEPTSCFLAEGSEIVVRKARVIEA